MMKFVAIILNLKDVKLYNIFLRIIKKEIFMLIMQYIQTLKIIFIILLMLAFLMEKFNVFHLQIIK